MLTRPLYFASLLALALPACAGQTDAAFDDASIDDDAKADRAGGGSSVLSSSARMPRATRSSSA